MSMTISEISEVLAYIAIFDDRDTTEAHILAWHQVFEGTNVTRDDALNRVRKFFKRRDTNRRLKPADLMPGTDDWMNQDRLD